MRTSSVPSRRLSKSGMAIRWVLAAAAFTVTVVVADSHVSRAADPAPTPSDRERIKQLEDTVNSLKKDTRQVEATLEGQKPLVGWTPGDGFNLTSADGKTYKLKLGGYTQLDGRYFINDRADALTNQFVFRRARLDFSGTVFRYFDFRVLPDFAGSQVILFDAYVDANYIPEAKLRVGKFKPPVGLERLQGAPYTLFIERGQPTNLVPNRDFGVQLFGDLLNGALSYQVAVLNGAPDNSNPAVGDVNDDKDFAGRIFAQPFKDLSIDALKGLGIGFSGTFGRQRGNTGTPDLPTLKTFGQGTFFQYKGAVAATMTAPAQGPTLAFGQRDRWSPQAYYYVGPFGLLAEYVNSTQSVRRDNNSGRVSNDAWQVAASFVLTGEAASYKGVTPAEPFDPFTGKWGAWEVAARYGQLHVDSDAFSQNFADPRVSARRDKEWVVGLNWYLNKNIKFMLDYAQSDFRGGFGAGDRPTESAIEGRVQLLL